MKERLPTLMSVLILCVLVVSTWLAAEYTGRAVLLDAPASQSHDPDTWVENFVTVRTNEDGMAVNRLEGDYLRHYPDDDSYLIDRPRAFNMQPGSPVTVATAEQATVLKEGDQVVMKGDAVLIRMGEDGQEPLNITSDEIVLLMDQNVAYTDLPAIAVRGMSRLSGVGMHYDNNSRELNVYGSSDLEIAPREKDKEREPS